MAKLESDHATAVEAMRKLDSGDVADSVETRARSGGFTFANQQKRRVIVTVDVEELQCPIELEVVFLGGAGIVFAARR